MMFEIKNKKTSLLKGFTIVESMVFLMLFSLIAIIFFQVYSAGTTMIIESKRRLGATALANQKMEIIRSIDYDDIGTKSWDGSAWVYGIPGGELLEDETISASAVSYEVHIFVQYADDTFDGTVSTTDAIPTDYKRVRVSVSWGNGGDDQTVAIFGNFSPNGVETSSGGGTLSINILDSGGAGISGATVRIEYPAESIDLTTTTDSTGNVMLPGSPAGTESYEITVSKNNYYGAITYPAYPTSAFSPVDIHASVVDATLNQKSIIIDQDVDIPLKTEDPFGNDIPNVNFTLEGGRVLGLDPNTGDTVYGFSATDATDGSGEITFSSESYGQYTFTESEAGYEFYKLSPESSTTATIFDLAAGSTSQITAILLDENIGSVRVTVTDQTDSTPISGASVRLQNVTLLYDTTLTTDQYGYVYFPSSLPGLTAGTYDLEVSATGYTTYTGTVDVNGVLETENIALTP